MAISNRRIASIDNGVVRFEYRDYADRNQSKEMVLAASELLRRFLQHVVPKGFMRIRHYGITANWRRKEKLARCRELLGQSLRVADTDERKATGGGADARDGGAIRCPACGGAVRLIEIVAPTRCIGYDTS